LPAILDIRNCFRQALNENPNSLSKQKCSFFKIISWFGNWGPTGRWGVLRTIWNFGHCDLSVICDLEFSIANHQSPITNRQSPIANHQSPIINRQSLALCQVSVSIKACHYFGRPLRCRQIEDGPGLLKSPHLPVPDAGWRNKTGDDGFSLIPFDE
jgi:hypothetical protein